MKEYRVVQMIKIGQRNIKWVNAMYPDGSKVPTFMTSWDAQAWIDLAPEVFSEYNRQQLQCLKLDVPEYRIESREVTPWKPLEEC